MENTEQKTMSITSHEVVEAMEQIRAGFTVSRIALGAATLLYALKKKGESWAKKFTKVQQDYHKFLLDTYTEFEKELPKLQEEESRQRADETGDNPEGVK